MTKPLPHRQTDNRHFRYAQIGVQRLHFALLENNYFQRVEQHLTDVECQTAEGWLELRDLPYPRYGPPYKMLEYFRSSAPKWLVDFHREVTWRWTFCEYEFSGSGHPEEPEVLLNAEQFKALLQTFLHNAILLYQAMEHSAIDVQYVASLEELKLREWADPRH